MSYPLSTDTLADRMASTRQLYDEEWFSAGFSYRLDEEAYPASFPDPEAHDAFKRGWNAGGEYLEKCKEEVDD